MLPYALPIMYCALRIALRLAQSPRPRSNFILLPIRNAQYVTRNSLDLDVDYLPNDEEANKYHDTTTDRHNDPGKRPHGVHVRGVDDCNHNSEGDGQAGNDIARDPTLRGQDRDFALHAHTLADGM